MLYKLPEPFRGATHISFYPIDGGDIVVGPDTFVRLSGTLGTLEKDTFVKDPYLLPAFRAIEGREYTEGFRKDAQSRGAPRGNFRDDDISAHLDKWGWQDAGKWYAKNPTTQENA